MMGKDALARAALVLLLLSGGMALATGPTTQWATAQPGDRASEKGNRVVLAEMFTATW